MATFVLPHRVNIFLNIQETIEITVLRSFKVTNLKQLCHLVHSQLEIINTRKNANVSPRLITFIYTIRVSHPRDPCYLHATLLNVKRFVLED